MQVAVKDDFQQAFVDECAVEYPVVDEIEKKLGYRLDPVKLLPAAEILACPVKVNPPNWQHGRILYAVARDYLKRVEDEAVPVTILDIGTAKGFSALCLQWALEDSGVEGRVHSVDVVGPLERRWRNTVLEVGQAQPMTLNEILKPWPEVSKIKFYGMTSLRWLFGAPGRINLAFVDGKHRADVVAQEAKLLSSRQVLGDVIVFDDVHIQSILAAIYLTLSARYDMEVVSVLSQRAYAICRKVR